MIFNEGMNMNRTYEVNLMQDKEILMKILMLIEKREMYLNIKNELISYDKNFYKLLNYMIIKEINKLKNILINRWNAEEEIIDEILQFEKSNLESDIYFTDEISPSHNLSSDYELNAEWK